MKAPLLLAALLATATGCGSSPAAPTATSGVPPSTALNLTGTWSGTGADAQGPEKFRCTLTLQALRTNTPIDIDVAFDDPLRSDES